ncbi:MAG: hypothetical protein K6U87_08905 [Firmicutes bacterium]|nr:hypothetical protein [Bacillota bacterium]
MPIQRFARRWQTRFRKVAVWLPAGEAEAVQARIAASGLPASEWIRRVAQRALDLRPELSPAGGPGPVTANLDGALPEGMWLRLDAWRRGRPGRPSMSQHLRDCIRWYCAAFPHEAVPPGPEGAEAVAGR